MKSMKWIGVLLAFLILSTTVSVGQTVVIPNVPDSLYGAIVAAKAGDVLLLQRGQSYPITVTCNINKALTIKAYGDPSLQKPIVIGVPGAAGGAPGRIFSITQNVTLSNLYFYGLYADSSIANEAVYIPSGANNLDITVDSCWIEYFKFGIASFSSAGHLNVTNTIIGNIVVPGDGRPIELRGIAHHYIKFQNNTMYNTWNWFITHWTFGNDLCSPIDTMIVDHNTFMNCYGQSPPFDFRHIQNLLKITDNLVVNPICWGADTISLRLWDKPYNHYIPVYPTNSTALKYFGPLGVNVWNASQAADSTVIVDMRNNNTYTETRVSSLWTGSPRIWAPGMMSNELKLGKTNGTTPFVDTLQATYSEVLTFTKMPVPPISGVQKYRAIIDTMANNNHQFNYYSSVPTTTAFDYVRPKDLNLAYNTTAVSYTKGSRGFPVGDLNWFPSRKAQWLVTSVEKAGESVPVSFALEQNYPNPFNPSTVIAYDLNKGSAVKLTIYNVLGQTVRVLVDERQSAGSYSAQWDGKDQMGRAMSSGVYYYELKSNSQSATNKMILMK